VHLLSLMNLKNDLRHYVKIYPSTFDERLWKDLNECLLWDLKVRHRFYSGWREEGFTVGDDPWLLELDRNNPKSLDLGQRIKDCWYKIISEYMFEFLHAEKILWFNEWTGYTFPKFIHYEEGQSMPPHCDHIHDIFDGKCKGVPILTLITMANDDYEGGELVLFGDVPYELKKGETIVFPSNFLFPHEIKKITKGKRLSLISWVH